MLLAPFKQPCDMLMTFVCVSEVVTQADNKKAADNKINVFMIKVPFLDDS